MGLASKLAAAAGASAPSQMAVAGGAPSNTQTQQPMHAQQAGAGYPPQQAASYPPQQHAAGYPPQQHAASYPTQQAAGYAPQHAAGYAPQHAASYPTQQPATYPPQQAGYPGAYAPTTAPSAPNQAAMGGASGAQSILARLQGIVQANGLQRFYPQQQLEAVAQRVARVDFHGLAARWRMPAEIALDLAALALYDVVILADDSGSMAFEDGGERIEDLKLILGRVAEVATLFDDDGVCMRFLNSAIEGNGLRSAADVSALLGQVNFGGTTPLAASMQSRVLAPIVLSMAARGQLAKPVLVVTITDGEPTDQPKDAILSVIRDARARLAAQYGPKAVAYQFAQVGRDPRAQAFLGKLDRDPSVGDVVDVTSYYELEAEECARKGVALSVEAWMAKLMLGAVDRSYDAEDD